MSELPWIWVVYDHPSDYPEHFVARAQRIRPDGTTEVGPGFGCDKLDGIRAYMEREGLVRLDRHPDDDPVILETWI